MKDFSKKDLADIARMGKVACEFCVEIVDIDKYMSHLQDDLSEAEENVIINQNEADSIRKKLREIPR
jgi:hypothetical protein